MRSGAAAPPAVFTRRERSLNVALRSFHRIRASQRDLRRYLFHLRPIPRLRYLWKKINKTHCAPSTGAKSAGVPNHKTLGTRINKEKKNLIKKQGKEKKALREEKEVLGLLLLLARRGISDAFYTLWMILSAGWEGRNHSPLGIKTVSFDYWFTASLLYT